MSVQPARGSLEKSRTQAEVRSNLELASAVDEEQVPRREQLQRSRNATNEQQSEATYDAWGSGSPSLADGLRNYYRVGRNASV